MGVSAPGWGTVADHHWQPIRGCDPTSTFPQIQATTLAEWVPRRAERREHSPQFLQGVEGPRRAETGENSPPPTIMMSYSNSCWPATPSAPASLRSVRRLGFLGARFAALRMNRAETTARRARWVLLLEGKVMVLGCGCAAYACTLEASNWIRPALARFPGFPHLTYAGTTPDKSERLASRQSNRRPDPLGFLFPKRRRSSTTSSTDPTPAPSKPSSNPFRRFRSPSRSTTLPIPEHPSPPRTATMTAAPTFDHYQPQSLHAKNNLKAWWKQFTFPTRPKREARENRGMCPLLPPFLDLPVPIHPQLRTPYAPYTQAQVSFSENRSRRVSNTQASRYLLPTPTASSMSGATSPWSSQSRAYPSP